jgi:hypothetical protein
MQLDQGSGRVMRMGAEVRHGQDSSAGLIPAGRARAAASFFRASQIHKTPHEAGFWDVTVSRLPAGLVIAPI